MDKLEQFRGIIKKILTDYYQLNVKSPNCTDEVALVFDDTHHHYLLLVMGWNKDERIKSILIHLRLKNRKIWIEEDWTEEGVATDLLQEGVSRDDIVLAFHPPQVRHYTEFAST